MFKISMALSAFIFGTLAYIAASRHDLALTILAALACLSFAFQLYRLRSKSDA